MDLIPIKKEKRLVDGREETVYLIPAMSFNTPNGKTKKVPHPFGVETIIVSTLEEAEEIVERSGYTYNTKKTIQKNTISESPYEYSKLIYDALIKLTSDEVSNVEASAIKALGEMQNPESVNLFIQKIGEDNEAIRTAAIEALKKYGTIVLPHLVSSLKDSNWIKRNSAIICIGEIATTSTGQIETVILPLIEMTKDNNTIVKASAAKVLGIIYKEINSRDKQNKY